MMTGFLSEKEFSRKSFVRGGGALIVGFSLLGVARSAAKRRHRSVRMRAADRPESGRLVDRDQC